ncbi:NeuD/PglB/VioB family sugar acetyltransferase [Terrabacter sp. Ter38]|uniref:NeuD/PglB/VioB family sugar acetyltransferase n=1 Tax=Terrabacter sp. Ter38 TaxID=2926030 RepID=UPI002119A50B|nr:NeuD/PglB/VioB family sugar acetyltransferase [Terrabacter sp. Ter38]
MTGDGTGWVVLGAGGHARSVVDVLERAGHTVAAVSGVVPAGESWHVDVLVDDREAFELLAAQGLHAVVAVGANPVRARLVRELVARGLSVPPVIAATATVSARSVLGAGSVVLEHAHVGPSSTLGEAVVVNTAAVVEHDCTVGAGSHVAPGAVLLGAASIGELTLVGSGARILPGVTVGSGVTVGAGAVVTTPVVDGETVVGVPAATRPPGGTA